MSSEVATCRECGSSALVQGEGAVVCSRCGATEITAGRAIAVRESAEVLAGSAPDKLAQAVEIANILSSVIEKQRLYSDIQGRRYVRLEGWTTLGALLDVFPVTVWTRRIETPVEGWEARVEARRSDGRVVGAAEAECTRAERNWNKRTRWDKGQRIDEPVDDYALRSMSQTRAAAKALRIPLGFIMSLSGFEVTPAEEMAFAGVDEGAPGEEVRAYADVPPEVEGALIADYAALGQQQRDERKAKRQQADKKRLRKRPAKAEKSVKAEEVKHWTGEDLSAAPLEALCIGYTAKMGGMVPVGDALVAEVLPSAIAMALAWNENGKLTWKLSNLTDEQRGELRRALEEALTE